MRKTPLIAAFATAALFLAAQQSDMIVKLTGGQRPVLAIPDFRGAGDAAQYMEIFNQTLSREIDTAGMFQLAP